MEVSSIYKRLWWQSAIFSREYGISQKYLQENKVPIWTGEYGSSQQHFKESILESSRIYRGAWWLPAVYFRIVGLDLAVFTGNSRVIQKYIQQSIITEGIVNGKYGGYQQYLQEGFVTVSSI